MRRHLALLVLLLAWLTAPAPAGEVRLLPSRLLITPGRLRPITPPQAGYAQLNRPGPVVSPDPYYTLKLGEAEVYRDAQDATLAYYRPLLHLAKRTGTPLAEGVGELAASLDAFRLHYYKFESGGSPKWGDVQVVVIAERPAEVTLEAVQASWRNVTRLEPLPFKLDVSTGVRLVLPYPPRAVAFSELLGTGGSEEAKWYQFSTNTHPTPADLLATGDNATLNESKVKDFAALLTSDLSDMPSFQPVLEVKATYAGWSGLSPLMRNLLPIASLSRLRVSPTPGTTTGSGTVAPSGGLRRPIGRPFADSGFHVELSAAVRRTGPARIVSPARTGAVLRPGLIHAIGTLQPRKDVDYTYSGRQQLVVRLPISYPKGKAEGYDYYFLSDSGRFGGPYFEPSPLPDRPQRAAAPAGFDGLWYESHSVGKRLVWPAPKSLRLRWEVESGLRPSCRFSLTSGEGGKLTAHLSYDLYPDFSTRQLAALAANLAKTTGEKVDLLPFPDLLDANQIALASGSQALKDLVQAKRVSITKLAPRTPSEAWLRLTVELPVDDWAALTLFMRGGDLGTWDVGVLTGASSGVAEKATFRLEGDLLQAMGGPVAVQKKSYDPATGGLRTRPGQLRPGAAGGEGDPLPAGGGERPGDPLRPLAGRQGGGVAGGGLSLFLRPERGRGRQRQRLPAGGGRARSEGLPRRGRRAGLLGSAHRRYGRSVPRGGGRRRGGPGHLVQLPALSLLSVHRQLGDRPPARRPGRVEPVGGLPKRPRHRPLPGVRLHQGPGPRRQQSGGRAPPPA